MADGVAYQNKDIIFKILSRNYPHVSMGVYGLDLPAVKAVLPTDLPDIKADDKRSDGIFELEDDTLMIMEYESSPDVQQLVKYGHYAFRVAERYMQTEKRLRKMVIVVIYTGEVKQAANALDLGGVRIEVEQVFLSRFDGDAIVDDVKAKIARGEPITDEDVMKLVMAPLAKTKSSRQELIERSVEAAKGIADENLQTFAIAGILVAADKFIDRDYSDNVRSWLNMTKVGQIILEEINEAVAAAEAKSAQEIARLKAEAAEAAQAAQAAQAALDSLGFMARAGVHESDLKLYAQIHSISDDDYERAVRT
jgi:hypothetical protein